MTTNSVLMRPQGLRPNAPPLVPTPLRWALLTRDTRKVIKGV